MDYIVRATAADGQIRAFAATTRETVETARAGSQHEPGCNRSAGPPSDGRCNDGRYDEGR